MKRLGMVWLLACLILAGVTRAEKVVDVQVRNAGPGSVDAAFVLGRMRTAAGTELDRAVLARDVKQLLDSGLFTDVYVMPPEPVDGGLRLVVAVVNRYRLSAPVAIEGAEALRVSKIRDLLGLQTGDLVDDAVLGAKAQVVLEEYRKKHYPDAGITWTLQESDRARGLAVVTLHVREGDRAPVRRVVFSGNVSIPDSELRKTMDQPAWWNPLWLFRKKRFDPSELDLARLQIRDLYLDRGYLDAEVDPPVVAADAQGAVSITVTVREGGCYRIESVSLRGVTLFPEAAVRNVFTLKKGDVASSLAVEQAATAVRDYYGSRGYIETSVKPVLTPAGKEAVSVDLVVTEGALARIRNIIIQGNTRTRDKVVRRELLVYPGEIYDEVKVRRSERIVSNLGFFSNVRSFPLATVKADEKDMIFQVEEKRTGNLMVGMGFSSIDQLMGFAELSQGNFDIAGWPYFTGAGQKLKLHLQAGSKRSNYGITFVEPWFLDRKLSLGLDLYRTDISYKDYDVRRLGGAVSLAKALTSADRLELRYRLERSRLRDIADTNVYEYVDSPGETYSFVTEDQDLLESSLTPTLLHDTRNNPFVPTRGNRTTVFGTVMGGALGADTDLYRLGFTSTQYVPLWWRHVISFRGRWETVESYSDTVDVPIDNRLFMGGGRTVRGYKYRDVGPKVTRTVTTDGKETVYHRSVGGQSLALASVEYTFPLLQSIRFAGFYDIGNVWRDPFDFKTDGLASSAGMGLRFDIPGFPIRIDYAWPLERDSELTREDPWVFWIGYDF